MEQERENLDPARVMIVNQSRCAVATAAGQPNMLALVMYGQGNEATLPMLLDKQQASDLLDAIQKAFPMAFPVGKPS